MNGFMIQSRRKSAVIMCLESRNGSIPISAAQMAVFGMDGISDGKFVPGFCRHIVTVNKNEGCHSIHPHCYTASLSIIIFRIIPIFVGSRSGTIREQMKKRNGHLLSSKGYPIVQVFPRLSSLFRASFISSRFFDASSKSLSRAFKFL